MSVTQMKKKRGKLETDDRTAYNVHLYWKQGSDFAWLLKRHRGNISKAFESMAKDLAGASACCSELSKLVKGSKKVEMFAADNAFLGLTGDCKVLDKAVEKKLLTVDEFTLPEEREDGEDE